MLHHLRFRLDCELDLQIPDRRRLERVKVQTGETIEAKVRPYILEEDMPIETADLQLGDDGILVGVRMECFEFV